MGRGRGVESESERVGFVVVEVALHLLRTAEVEFALFVETQFCYGARRSESKRAQTSAPMLSIAISSPRTPFRFRSRFQEGERNNTNETRTLPIRIDNLRFRTGREHSHRPRSAFEIFEFLQRDDGRHF